MDNSRPARINKGVKRQPSLATERLSLRPLMVKDAPAVRRMARSRKIARTIHWVFLPYSEAQARRWIASTAQHFAARTSVESASN